MKQLSIFIILLISFSVINNARSNAFQVNSKFLKSSKSFREEPVKKETTTPAAASNTAQTETEEGTGKLLWEGWVKYFHYDSSYRIKKPDQFFINDAFFKQRITNSELKKKNSEGVYDYIQNKYAFYTRFYPKNINFLSEKHLNYGKTVENLNINLIKPVDSSEPLNGPIRDLGSFNEGSCISILALTPKTFDAKFLALQEDANSKSESWILCFENDKEKEKVYTYLLTYKLLSQKEQGIEIALRGSTSTNKLKAEETPKFERYEGSDAKPEIDGYLMLIQDWTGCTLKCGGGESFQQWRCIPPKKGGKPCQGDLIRKKSCNTQACPGVSTSKSAGESEEEKEEHIDFKPIFKSAPFIDRPQQNIPCQIREDDVLYEHFDKKSGFNVKIPGRLLINTKSISLFEDSSYDNAVFSYNLDQTDFAPFADDFCCFFLSSKTSKTKICALANCGSKSDPKFVNSWKYSFSLFKKKCFKSNVAEKLSDDKTNEKNHSKEPIAEVSPTLKSMNIEASEVNEREKIIEDKLNEDAELALESKVTKVQETALKAVTRELNLEERLKREEMMKAKEETKYLIQKVELEKEKEEKIEQAIEEQEVLENKELEKRQTNTTATAIVGETEKLINEKRKKLKERIAEIRKMSDRRKRLIENKIKLIRGKMAEEIVTSNKAGSINTCKNNLNKADAIKSYCDANVLVDFNKNRDCKVLSSFCYICCETEFGAAQFNNRSKCYDMCDAEAKK